MWVTRVPNNALTALFEPARAISILWGMIDVATAEMVSVVYARATPPRGQLLRRSSGPGTRRWRPSPMSLKRAACGPLEADRLGNLCKCRGCWRLSGLGRPLCALPARIVATTDGSIRSQLSHAVLADIVS